MTLPTERQVHDLFTTLRTYVIPPGKEPSRIDHLERRLLAALNRDRSGTTTTTGYPTGTLGDGRGGSDHRPVEHAAFTTEQADLIREHTWHAASFLTEAAGNLGALEHRLDLIDKISQPAAPAETAGTGYCEACGDYCSGAGDDRLRSGFCNACRAAWDRAGRPDRATFKRQRRVPT